MEFNIMKNNNFDMIYININEGTPEENFFIQHSGNGSKNNLESDEKHFKINNFSNNLECLQTVSKDKSKVVLTFNRLSLENTSLLKRLKLKGLNEDANYINEETNEVFSGGALMYLGIHLNKLFANHSNNIIHLKMI